MSNAIAINEDKAVQQAPQASQSLLPMIDKLVERPDFDVEKLERLLDMQERIMTRSAMEQFNAAMAMMQDELPSIAERGKAHNTKYATFEDINDVAKPIMKTHGFAVSFRVHNIQGGIEVTGVLMHKGGHREETTMTLPLDTSGSKNAVQAVGSSVSYGKRYVMSALLNITTRSEDDDGESAAPTKRVTSFQAAQLAKALAACPDTTQEWFASNYGDASNVPKAKFDITMAQLSKIVAQQEVANAGDQGA
ncbi:ERF family protein [Vreelandella titanicae]|uniref:ERF family protein n=1 Tax=Vreelandella titanicae TaxID=664683 RepID=UPI00381F417D